MCDAWMPQIQGKRSGPQGDPMSETKWPLESRSAAVTVRATHASAKLSDWWIVRTVKVLVCVAKTTSVCVSEMTLCKTMILHGGCATWSWRVDRFYSFLWAAWTRFHGEYRSMWMNIFQSHFLWGFSSDIRTCLLSGFCCLLFIVEFRLYLKMTCCTWILHFATS